MNDREERTKEFIALMQAMNEQRKIGLKLVTDGLRLMAESKNAAAKRQQD